METQEIKHTIELSEKSIFLLERQTFTENNIVLVKIDVGNIPLRRATDYMENIKNSFQEFVSPAKLVVMPNSTTVEILEKEV